MSPRRRATDSLPPDPHHVSFERTARLAELGVLTASLVHELKQPLMALRGNLQLQQAGSPGVTAAELLEQVARIEELLEHYSGFGRTDEPPQPFDGRGPLTRGVEMLRPRAREQRVEIDVEVPADRVPLVGRPMALQQVVVNLVQNALDAVHGCVAPRVAVRLSIDGGAARLSVLDNGAGVDPAVRGRLFEPFVSSKPAGSGTGLGLHVARGSVAELGGTLILRDAPSGGTEALAHMPLPSLKE